MTTKVAVVIRCADQITRLHASVQSVLGSDAVDLEVAIVVDDSTAIRSVPWIESLTAQNGVTVVRASGSSAAAAFNAGIRATTADHVACLNAGDRFDREYVSCAARLLMQDQTVEWVAPWSLLIGYESQIVRGTTQVDAKALIANPGAVCRSSMFRRRLFAAIGGFDESLPVLEDYDFWLHTIAAEAAGTALTRPLVHILDRDDSLHHRSQCHESRADVIAQLVRRYPELFDRHGLDTLSTVDRELQDTAARYRARLARRDRLLAERSRLESRRDELMHALPPEARRLDLGDLQRTTPMSPSWGYERGTPIDRWYIERFLEANAFDVAGVVLEVQEADYTQRFGGARVTVSDVIDLDPANPRATICADLRSARNIPSARYDCIILTQTLHVVDDMRAVLAECKRILKDGGVLLATFPCASRVCVEYGWDGDFWRLTEAGARHLFADLFPADRLTVNGVGNVQINMAFSYGLASHELTPDDYARADPLNPSVITVRAVKARPTNASQQPVDGLHRARGASFTEPRVLLYHRVGALESDLHELSIPGDEFQRQMNMVRHECVPMSLDAFSTAAREGTLPSRAVAITVDDGYADSLFTASPILQTLGLPATFFVTTAVLDRPFEYWWDTIERVLVRAEDVPPHLSLAPAGLDARMPTGDPAERLRAYWAIYDAMRPLSRIDRQACLDALLSWSGAARTDIRNRRLRRAELRELASRPRHDIGAHTASHVLLPGRSDDEARQEIDDCRHELERVLERPVTTFAYPYGVFDERTVAAVRRAGFQTAVTCESRLVGPSDDALTLPRIDVSRLRGKAFRDALLG